MSYKLRLSDAHEQALKQIDKWQVPYRNRVKTFNELVRFYYLERLPCSFDRMLDFILTQAWRV